MKAIFITGTDTNIGKTILSSLLCSALQKAKLAAAYFKPIQTGTDDDTLTVKKLSQLSDDSIVSPAYRYAEPMSPNRAAELNGESIQISTILNHWSRCSEKKYWVVEGAGGILVPINQNETIKNLIQAMRVPVLIASSTRLGTINHTLLTIEAIRAAKIPLVGTVLLGKKDPGLKQVIEKHSNNSVIAEVPWLDPLSAPAIREMSEILFPTSLLIQIFEGLA
jgi:dethiobiotin synthetase